MSTKPQKRILEVCVDSLVSAQAAAAGGADRLELCAGLAVGGLTPPVSLLRAVKRKTGLPVRAMVRPRFGDFLYTEEEFSLMLEDAEALLEDGADGIVAGFLEPDGAVDRRRTEAMLALVRRQGKRFTFHRAFDLCADPFSSLELLQGLGADTVLTSGQAESCLAGMETLEKLCKLSGGVELLIGGGVNAEAIRRFREAVPEAAAFHMSGKRMLKSGMRFCRPEVRMGLPGLRETEILQTDEALVRAAREELDRT